MGEKENANVRTIFVTVTAKVEIPEGVDVTKVMEEEGIAAGGNLALYWQDEESSKLRVVDVQLEKVDGITEEEWLG